MPTGPRILALLLSGWLAFQFNLDSSAAYAAPNPDSAAAEPDNDFLFQGEYSGSVLTPANCLESIGLQVIALGDGKFQAAEFRGGLPAQGWDGATRSVLTGTRHYCVLTLSGDSHKVTIRDGQAWIWEAGRQTGQLQKVQRQSPTAGAAPPTGATVLFAGTHTDMLKGASITEDGLLKVGSETVRPYGDFFLHVEFRTPFQPQNRSQGRGNSGVYMQGRYEVQILDSFGLEPQKNEAGSLYKTRSPDWNMSYPPGSWQTYDINFRAARFDSSGQKIANARVSVQQNGVVIHNDYEIPNKTGAGAAEAADPRPIKFQDHRDPVVFRNIWIIDYDTTSLARTAAAPNVAANCCAPICSSRRATRHRPRPR